MRKRNNTTAATAIIIMVVWFGKTRFSFPKLSYMQIIEVIEDVFRVVTLQESVQNAQD